MGPAILWAEIAKKSAPRFSKFIFSCGVPCAQSIKTLQLFSLLISTIFSIGFLIPKTLLVCVTQTNAAPSRAISKASISSMNVSLFIGTYLTSTPFSLESSCHGTISA